MAPADRARTPVNALNIIAHIIAMAEAAAYLDHEYTNNADERFMGNMASSYLSTWVLLSFVLNLTSSIYDLLEDNSTGLGLQLVASLFGIIELGHGAKQVKIGDVGKDMKNLSAWAIIGGSLSVILFFWQALYKKDQLWTPKSQSKPVQPTQGIPTSSSVY